MAGLSWWDLEAVLLGIVTAVVVLALLASLIFFAFGWAPFLLLAGLVALGLAYAVGRAFWLRFRVMPVPCQRAKRLSAPAAPGVGGSRRT